MGRVNGAQAVRRTTVAELGDAVHRAKALSREGVLERLFTLAFRGLVYPQIWEDPVVDMQALALGPGDRCSPSPPAAATPSATWSIIQPTSPPSI